MIFKCHSTSTFGLSVSNNFATCYWLTQIILRPAIGQHSSLTGGFYIWGKPSTVQLAERNLCTSIHWSLSNAFHWLTHFDHADFSNEETLENGETDEDDKAATIEILEVWELKLTWTVKGYRFSRTHSKRELKQCMECFNAGRLLIYFVQLYIKDW